MARGLWIFTGLAALVPAPAIAQMADIPIWSNGILGQQALRNTYDNYNKANGIDARQGNQAKCSADSLPPSQRRAMEQEYARRSRTDGKASADAWVREEGKAFRMKLVAQGVCPAPKARGNQAAGNRTTATKKKLFDKNGRPCAKTRLETRVVPNVSGGAMTMGLTPVCAD